MKKTLALIAVSLFLSPLAMASEDLLKDFDSLGGNKVLMDRAKSIRPDAEVTAVQERTINRFKRHEFSPEAGMVMMGNRTMNSYTMGLNYQYHINPNWSVGAQYSYFSNKLTRDGENLINGLIDSDNEDLALIPAIDFPKQSMMANLSWYPIYGKINLRNLGITHFDVYLSGNYGQIDLKSGKSDIYGLGSGFAFWFSQHLTSRIDFRYQRYTENTYVGPQDVDMVVGGLSLGYML